MKNLMTRKIVLGILMTLVLAFSVQGVAEALSGLSQSGLPDDLTNQNIGTSMTVTVSATPDQANNREAVTVSVSGGGANFLVDGTVRTSHTFYEEDGDDTTAGFQDGTLTVPTLTIAIRNYGKVTVRIRDTSSVSSADRAPEIVRTYYAVRLTGTPRTASIRLAGISNGINEGYIGLGRQLIYNGDGSHYAVTYTISTGSTAEIVEGSGANERARDYTSDTTTSSAAKIYLKERTGSATVTAQVTGAEPEYQSVGVYVYQYATLVTPVTVTGGASDGTATPGQQIISPAAFTATVNDGAGNGISGVPVKFEVKDKSVSGGYLLPGNATIVDASNKEIRNAQRSKILYVQTATGGAAAIGYEVGSAGRKQVVTVSAVGDTDEVEVISTAAADRVISVYTNQKQSGSSSKYDLIILVEDDGVEASGVEVEFQTLKGQLTNRPTGGSPTTAQRVEQVTNPEGQAQVIYDAGDHTGPLEVIATVHKTANEIAENTPETDEIRLIINVSGGGVTPPRRDPDPVRTEAALSFNLGTSIRGSEGDEITIEARATDRDGFRVPQVPVSFTISDSDVGSLSVSSGDTNSNGVARTVLTLGDEDGTITASANGYTNAQASITVEPAPAGLEVASGSGQTGTPGSTLSSPFVVRFEDTEGNPISGAQVTFTVETGGGSLSRSTDTTDSDGEAETILTLGSVGMRNTVRANVDSAAYPGISSITFTAEAARGPEAVVIAGGDRQIGQIGQLLDEDLSVQVVDGNDDGVSGILVRFRISEGRGRLARNSARTDNNGYAEIGFTPTAHGETVVEAYSTGLTSAFFTITTGEPPDDILKVSGDNQSGSPGSRLANPFVVEVVDENDDPVSDVTITFAVTAGGGSVSSTSVTTNGTGRAQTYLRLGDEVGENTVVARVTGLTAVTFTATSGAEVLVSAAQRPPLYWISRAEGKLHRLVDAEVENLAPNIDGILSLTVDTQNELLYWTRQTAKNKSAIQRAGLNGRGVITLQTSLTLMTSIAVDSTGTTLYWADILGKIKSRPVQGNRVTLLAQNLSSPTGLVWANEYLYWGEATGQIRRMNLRNNRRTIETITTSAGEPVSLAVHSGRVYWTEISGNVSQLNRVNTNGTGVEALKTLAGSRRVWLDVDGSDSKIYLTRLTKLERRSLSGKSAKTLVESLQSPGSLVLGGTLPTGPPVVSQPSQPTQPPTQTTYSMYDINEDGAINNTDMRLVAADINKSGDAITNRRADVDGSGTVDVTDLILVLGNLDADVAAPAIDVDLKAMDVDFDRVQEQVEVLLASGDRSIAAQRALLYLQHLLALARPDETVLLANYPNPFNPETWIPYHLSESTDVRVNIYDAQGVLVRVLPLGHQTAGYYTSRSRAAYWDGLNALGERVASGIYFYQLQTDTVSPMRKMVILK